MGSVQGIFLGMTRLVKAADVSDSMRCLFITSGYRPSLNWSSCVRSILVMHNETINIWTHLLGFCYFFWLFQFNLFDDQKNTHGTWDLLPILIQLLTYQIG